MWDLRVENGDIAVYGDMGEFCYFLNEPAVVIDKCTGMFKWGNEPEVRKYFNKACAADVTGILSKNWVLFVFDLETMSKEFVAQEMQKMMDICDYGARFLQKILGSEETGKAQETK